MKAKLSDEQVAELVRAYMDTPVAITALARRYGVSVSTIQRITSGRIYRRVTASLGLRLRLPEERQMARGTRSRHAKLDDAKVRQIRQLDREGVPSSQIAPLMGVTPENIRAVIKGLSWKHVQGI